MTPGKQGNGKSVKQSPLISVLMPAYKAQDSIVKTIASLQEQSLKDWQLIVCVDGNFDNTFAVVSEIAATDDRIYCEENPHQGVAKTRNRLLELATGDYVFFLDADDFLRPHAFQDLVERAVEDFADIVIGQTLRYSSRRHYQMSRIVESGFNNIRRARFVDEPRLVESLGTANKLIRRSIIGEQRFFEDLDCAEDQPLIIGSYLRAKSISVAPRITYYWVVSETDHQTLTQQIGAGNPAFIRDQIRSLRRSVGLIGDALGDAAPPIQEALAKRVVELDLRSSLGKYFGTSLDIDDEVIHEFHDSIEAEFPANVTAEFHRLVRPIFLQLIVRETFPKGRAGIHPMLNAISAIVRDQHPEGLHINDAASYFLTMFPPSLVLKSKSDLLPTVRVAGRRITPMAFLVLHLGLQKLPWVHVRRAISLFFLSPIGIYSAVRKSLRVVVRAASWSAIRLVRWTNSLLPLSDFTLVAGGLHSADAGLLAILKSQLPKEKLRVRDLAPRSLLASLGAARQVARARTIVLTDYTRVLYGFKRRPGQRVIQLWHASGAFKKFGLSALGAGDSNEEQFEIDAHGSYSHVVCSSEGIRPAYAEAFDMDLDQVYALGVASTDRLFDEAKRADARERMRKEWGIAPGQKVALYAPTFRGGPAARKRFAPGLDLVDFAEKLGSDWVVAYRAHPAAEEHLLTEEEQVLAINASACSSFDALAVADFLVTDYSSMVFDAAVMNLPFTFYTPDRQSYDTERGFYDEILPYLQQFSVVTVRDLANRVHTLTDAKANSATDKKAITAFKNFYTSALDGHSADRIARLILDSSEVA